MAMDEIEARRSVIEVSETEFDAAVRALQGFDPADWQDGYLRPEEIVRAICSALRVQVRKDDPALGRTACDDGHCADVYGPGAGYALPYAVKKYIGDTTLKVVSLADIYRLPTRDR